MLTLLICFSFVFSFYTMGLVWCLQKFMDKYMMYLYQSNLPGLYYRAKNESSYLKHTSYFKHATHIPFKKRLCKDRLAFVLIGWISLAFLLFIIIIILVHDKGKGKKEEFVWGKWRGKKASSNAFLLSLQTLLIFDHLLCLCLKIVYGYSLHVIDHLLGYWYLLI